MSDGYEDIVSHDFRFLSPSADQRVTQRNITGERERHASLVGVSDINGLVL